MGIVLRVARRLGQIDLGLVPLDGLPLFARLGIQGGLLLQHRVELQLLVHHGLEFQHGGLQEVEGLLKLRRQHLVERHLLRHLESLLGHAPTV